MWREHQKADKARVNKEKTAKRVDNKREKALVKLSKADRKLLGV